VSIVGDSDGLVSPGETFKLSVAVTAKERSAGSLLVALRNRNGSTVKLLGARRRHEALKAGETWTANLSFEARAVSDALEFDLTVGATKAGVWHSDRLVLPVVAKPLPTASCPEDFTRAKEGALLRQGGSLQSAILATVSQGSKFKCLGRSGSWWRVQDRAGREGFLAGPEAEPAKSASELLAVASSRRPPKIELIDAEQGYEVLDGVLSLKALVKSQSPLKHVVVYRRSETGRKKVALVGGSGLQSNLDLQIPLEPGHNLISIQALQGVAYGASQSFWVLSRKGWDPALPTKHHRSHAQVRR